MYGKLTHAIILFELDNGEHAALMYGVEGSAAKCYDYVMATAADGETHVKYGGGAKEFIQQAAQIVGRQLQERR